MPSRFARPLWFALALLPLVAGGCRSTARSHEPANLAEAKAAVVAYHDSGLYLRDVAGVAARAEAWLNERAARRAPGERLAVVFDLDETLLSNYGEMVSLDFGYSRESWSRWVNRAEAPALEPMRELHAVARRLGYDILFITGRGEEQREATLLNLQRQGLAEHARLVMATARDRHLDAAVRKAAARAALEAEGYTIVASIGDQDSDLAGGHAERTFKVPNPFYHVP